VVVEYHKEEVRTWQEEWEITSGSLPTERYSGSGSCGIYTSGSFYVRGPGYLPAPICFGPEIYPSVYTKPPNPIYSNEEPDEMDEEPVEEPLLRRLGRWVKRLFS
jgi:hypothetical protein